ncbi:hypothetical protein [Paraliomyxa miuraensis]|uniref:hypothetical protein n=1 Tax=Paraliomyxa miuraensis TaxID=376150 RepID=UPI002253E4D7|nr:hypothetical protein [Paraliomyxa miuraensis]MCX4246511.1 hypothetical protein [Paraliomyxa miuraensis]
MLACTPVLALPVLGMADRVPNEEALALAPSVGWLMFACAVFTAIIFVSYREGWRRLWLRMDDPRSMGAFRIVFALCAVCNVNGLWELFPYLFTDEGLFVTDVARQVYAGEQFEGFGNGLGDDPYGFFGWDGFWQWAKGPKYSLLFFDSTPTFFWVHLWAFELAMAMLIVGWKTRYTKWIAWFLFHSITLRNTVYWEGTENVYRCFFFYVCVSRCGHAYSVDNWLRCRRLRKQGRLSEPGGPGNGAGVAPSDEHPSGLEAIYRLIPAWPRLLVILQCAALYCYTGVVKNGRVWWNGDAFYYAFNLDHFYRIPPQWLSSVLGTNLFRVNTHVVHAWESLFPVAVFGLIVRWVLHEDLPRLSRRARAVANLGWVGLGLSALAVVWVAYPVHFVQPRGSWWTLERVQWVYAAGWILLLTLFGVGWWKLRYRPWRPTIRGRTHVLDLDWFCRWFLGRRVWVTLGVIFHLHLMLLMNIGWFQPGALSGFICFLNGAEIAMLLLVIQRRLARRLRWLPPQWQDAAVPVPAEDPTLPHHHRDAARLPTSAIVIATAVAAVGVPLQAYDVLAYGWTLVGIAAFLGGAMWREARATHGEQLAVVPRFGPIRRHETAREGTDEASGDPSDDRSGEGALRMPWAYGPLGRYLVGCLTLYHVVGVACWLLPDKDCFDWRTATHEPFRKWLEMTHTTQGWKMFAPNPPRSNMFLRVEVKRVDGEVIDMNTDVYHPSQRPNPWIWYTRQRKINRRIAGGEGGHGNWYQKWHARWFCRQWTLEHGGEILDSVELSKITYNIPSPEQVAEKGPYDPWDLLERTGKDEVLLTVDCTEEVEAQPPNVVRARYGLPPANNVRRWNSLRNKKRRWDARSEREEAAKRAAEEAEAAEQQEERAEEDDPED